MITLAQALTDAKREGWSHWIKSEADERAVLDGCYFDEAAGQHWVDLCQNYFQHTRGDLAGKSFSLLDWQKDDFIMPVFGWMRDRSRPGIRRYSKGDVFIAKKNGKSTLAAFLAVAFLLKGGSRAEVYGVAHTREQAGIIYQEAAAMARASQAISARLKPLDSRKRIVYRDTNSFYQALAGESGARGAEGINPLLILFDEIHVQRSRELYDALAYASAARENSLMLSVSTVGVADQTTIWWEQYEYAQGIINGTITDNTRFAYIAQADPTRKDDASVLWDRDEWRKANPSLGHTVTEEKIAEYVREAENSPAKLNNLLRYVFNIPTAQVTKVVPMDEWRACRWEGELPDLRGRRCYGGLDMASSEDLTAFVLYFPPEDDETRGFIRSWFWCPAEKVRERELKNMAFYRVWVDDKHLTETPGSRIDHTIILEHIRECCDEYQLEELHYDKWNADAVIQPLELDDVLCVSVNQTFDGMSQPCSALLKAIAGEEVHHEHNAVLDWCLSNAAGETLDGKDGAGDVMKFSKKKSADKIDGAVAAAMAVGAGVLAGAEDGFGIGDDMLL